MKNQKLIAIVLIVVLILVVSGITAGISFYYGEYKRKVDYFAKQNSVIKAKFTLLEKDFEGFKYTLAKLDSQADQFSDDLQVLGKNISDSKDETRVILTKLEETVDNIQVWHSSYSSALASLEAKMGEIKDGLKDALTEDVDSVELGKIDVEKEGVNQDSAESETTTDISDQQVYDYDQFEEEADVAKAYPVDAMMP